MDALTPSFIATSAPNPIPAPVKVASVVLPVHVMPQYVSAGVVQLVALPLLAWQGRQNTRAVERHTDHLARVHDSLAALHKHLGTGHGEAPQA